MSEKAGAGKNKVRFNILDAIIILLVILCIVGISFRYSIMERLGFGQELSDFTVNFTLSSVSYTLPGFLSEGDKLYFSSGREAGMLLGVSGFSTYTKETAKNQTLLVEPATIYTTDKAGNPVLATYPEFSYIDARGAFQCRGAYNSADTYFALGGNQYLAPGQSITLYTDKVTLTITITGISPVK